MSKITHVEVQYGETRSVNYQSATCMAQLRAELEPGDEPDEVRGDLEMECIRAVHKAFEQRDSRRAAEILARVEAQSAGGGG
jgi:hypothetical protein